ncbi:MAG: CHC2 zinc finger domain-containing protein [Planctomycetia bacterium]|nr:CHC2 zinc finger domain-containing protein [Planctomycetia bacterium]
MLNSFSSDIKEKVRQATDIVDLVRQYVHLVPKGRIYRGLCPWHDDSDPSLQVHPDRQTFRCWVCNIGGDVFDFVMKMEGLTFPEALRSLAEKAGIEIPKMERPNAAKYHRPAVWVPEGDVPAEQVLDGLDISSSEGKRGLYEAAKWASDQCHACLARLEESHPIRRYLSERQITDASIEKFQIGFCPNEPGWLQGKARREPGLLKRLYATGFLGKSKSGGYYEIFSGRLLFPIRDNMGRTVGMGGRVVPGVETFNEKAKYLNTSETPLFSKHRLLYNMDQAKLVFSKKRRVLVMEGYTDTILATQYGFQEAVAVLGTALGVDHVKMLKRFVEKIYLVLDGDEAGQKNMARVLEMFLAEKVDVQLLTLPEGMDPAEYLEANGAEALEDLLQTRTVDAWTYAYNVYTKGLDLSNVHDSEMALEKILTLIASGSGSGDLLSESSFREAKMLQQLAFRFTISETFLRKRLRELREEAKRVGFLRQQNDMRRQREELEKNWVSPPPPKGGKSVELDESEAWSDDPTEVDDFADVRSERISEAAWDDLTLLTGEAFEQAADEIPWERFGKPDAWQKEFLTLLLFRPNLLEAARKRLTPERLNYVPAREVFLRMCELADDGLVPDLRRLLLSFESGRVKSWLVELVDTSVWESEDKTDEEIARILQKLLDDYERFQMNGRKLRNLEAFRASQLDESQKIAMLDQLIRDRRKGLKD